MLRQATEADIPIIRELAQRIWWDHYPNIIGADQVRYMLALMYGAETLQRQMTEEEQTYWLIYADDELPAGFIAVSQKTAGSYFLHKFYLDTARQGKGLGARAFTELLAQYPDLREIRLTVNRKNYKSINFYFKTGFTIEHCLDIPIGEGFVMEDFQMVWRKG